MDHGTPKKTMPDVEWGLTFIPSIRSRMDRPGSSSRTRESKIRGSHLQSCPAMAGTYSNAMSKRQARVQIRTFQALTERCELFANKSAARVWERNQ